jgi:hypothetical protein
MPQDLELRNELWQTTVSGSSGDVIQLRDVIQDSERVQTGPRQADLVQEGGFCRPPGLGLWVKTGDQPDHNTGVLSAFAAVHKAPRTFRYAGADMVEAVAEAEGLKLTVRIALASGAQPLRLMATLENRSAAVVPCQFEGFFQWHSGERESTAYVLPGLAPKRLLPFGELYYKPGREAGAPAAWWRIGTDQGVVMRAVRGVDKYFVGVQKPMFVLGPHSVRRELTPGETLDMALEIAPLRWARQQGWTCVPDAEAAVLAEEDQRRAAVAVRLGGVSAWCRREAPAIRRRVVHVTTQYQAQGTDDLIRLMEQVLAPAGFNELVFEVGRNFRYRTHPKIAPDWAWDAATWRTVIRAARGLGLVVVPQYNALGHQSESGLATAYPELAEDPGGWCLNPEHPRTLPCLREVIGELIEVFEPRCFHVGLDEIDVPSRPQTFALSKPGRTRDGGELFALHINGLHDVLKGQGVEMWMWADMLLHRPEHQCQHGLRTGAWKAVDLIPRDILMVDWIYHRVPCFGGSLYLQEKGFRAMGATWHMPENIRDWARFAVEHSLEGLMHTTWTAPAIRDVNLVCTLLAGRYFQDPRAPPPEQLIPEAEALGLALVNKG